MKKPEIKNQPVSTLGIARAIPTLDGQGIHEDNTFLTGAKWEVTEDTEENAVWSKSDSALRLRASQDEDNEHRIKWELSIHANGTQVAYASIVLRPGDMNGSTTKRLIEEALEAGDEEFKKWSDALSAARALLQA